MAESEVAPREGARITLCGIVTVTSVASVAERAREALESGGPITIDTTGLEYADVSLVQLLSALSRSARSAGVDVAIEGDTAVLTDAVAGSTDLAAILAVAH